MRLCFFLMLFFMPVWAFTPTETNQVVRSLLNRIMADAYDDNLTLEGRVLHPEECIDTWETFIGGTHAPGWSFEDKKGAFDWYLSTWGQRIVVHSHKGRRTMFSVRFHNATNFTTRMPYPISRHLHSTRMACIEIRRLTMPFNLDMSMMG